MSQLFSPIRIRGLEFKNRIFVSPMCQYSARDSQPTDWHLVHYGSRAVGGAACLIMEATAVSPEGRISPDDLGLWSDDFIPAFKRITDFIKTQNVVPGIQLAHAGRKASVSAPWKGDGPLKKEEGAWPVIAPSAIPFDRNFPVPREMSLEDIEFVKRKFIEAAIRGVKAGFELIEIHQAHGFLVHQFLSPLSNKRIDSYGGSLENRCRLALEIAKGIRENIPDNLPLLVRVSSTDWVENGWDIEQSLFLAHRLKEAGVDLIDCSSGGNVPNAKIPAGPGYQLPFSERIKKEVKILTGGLGFITSPEQAETVIRGGQADIVLLGREFLRHPYWPLEAAKKLRAEIKWPEQYLRAKN
ncbi:MAG TPA: NADH:flavin oxidoreductase/NADH oxidase [Candidatus Saccharicenans sp.]|nr:NADH:flavin oxidoreductase/NADH oxidase [Candidatus Saccharicenans sp.]